MLGKLCWLQKDEISLLGLIPSDSAADSERTWSSNLTFGPSWLKILTNPRNFVQSCVNESSFVSKTLKDNVVKDDLCIKCSIKI